ncbi:AaceriAGL158Cp [[Ashbya] aceris (nom. inval.)]|nr:AaceriAGL158Cp [[Ashbya] aceris (nom. inval.)]
MVEMLNPFAFDNSKLLEVYQLKTLNPRSTWEKETPRSDSTENSEASRQQRSLSDIPDPLEPSRSMEQLLEQLHIPPEERHKYYINCNSFNTKLFLRNIHKDDTFRELADALESLNVSMKEEGNDLKNLVQTNFVRYVRCKSNLDQIYDQFNKRMSGNENFLGIDHLDESVNNMVRGTTMKVIPLVDQASRVKHYKSAIRYVQENKELFDLPKTLIESVNKKDYGTLMSEYKKGCKLYAQTKQNHVVTKIWKEVETIIDQYRNHTWEQLLESVENENQEYFLPLISKLVDLKVEENPVNVWMTNRLKRFHTQLKTLSQTMMEKIVNAQRDILKNNTAENIDLTFYLNMETYSEDMKNVASRKYNLTDSPIVIEMWLLILKYITSISDLCTKFVEFWEHVERFMNNSYQTTLLNEKRKENIIGLGDQTQEEATMLQLSKTEVAVTREGGQNFIKLLNRALSDLFMSTQQSLGKEQSKVPEGSYPSHFGFIPPRCNSLSCLRYLPKIVDPILKFTTELAQLTITDDCIRVLRALDEMILDRCVGAISSTKLRDMSNSHELEDWEVFQVVGDEKYCITQYPEIVLCFNQYSIRTMRDILFSYEKLPVLNGISIVSYPSDQLLAAIELQQITSLESVLESILKNAAKDKDNPRNSHTILTLTNLQHIKAHTFPEILQYFDEAFESNLNGKKLEIFALLKKMESSIFGNYLSGLKMTLRDILEEKFHDINWATHSSNSFRAGDYIIETLMILVTVHSECFQLGPQLIQRILKESQIFISKYLFEAFKPYIGHISSDGLLQITVDLQFFQRVLRGHLEHETETILNACLQSCFQNDTQRVQRCITETDPIVTSNLNRTSVQFASFE